MNRLRLLESITPSGIGGAELFVINACLAFQQQGELSLFCPKGRPFLEHASKHGLQPVSWKTCGKLDPITVYRLVMLIRQQQIQILHSHLSTASLLGAVAARLSGIPSVAHVHGLNSAGSYRLASRLVAVSSAVKEHLCKQGISENKIMVIHNGVDLTRFQPQSVSQAREQLDLQDGPLIGVFGRLSPEKGQETAIQAMVRLRAKHPAARLLLVGRGREEARLTELTSSLGLDQNVVFTGFQADIRSLMAACDVVVVPSRKEGFGLTAVEAMALARPVLASRVGGLPEVVEDGRTGLLFPVNDTAALAEMLEGLINNPARAEELGQQGRQRVERFFDMPVQLGKLFNLLSDTVEGQRK